jgi:hypothetical protein
MILSAIEDQGIASLRSWKERYLLWRRHDWSPFFSPGAGEVTGAGYQGQEESTFLYHRKRVRLQHLPGGAIIKENLHFPG